MKRQIIVGAILTAALVILPFIVEGYWLRVLTNTFMYAILAQSINIIAGYAGYLALGNVVFFGTGAYIAAALMNVGGMSLISATILSGLGCALYATLVGLPILRLSGRYFLMATIALNEITRELVGKIPQTGGSMGTNFPILSGTPSSVYRYFYYLMLTVLVLCVVTVIIIDRSKLGFGLKAIKFDEEAAAVMGVPATHYKTAAWAISALYAGLAGAVFGNWMTFIEPAGVFALPMSIKTFLMYIFGGAGTLFGPVIGAFTLDTLSELVWSHYNHIHYLILGLVIVFVVTFMPQGLVQLAPAYQKVKDMVFRKIKLLKE